MTEITSLPKKRLDLLKWNGWGYRDSQLYLKDGTIHFSGSRYSLGSDARLPKLKQWTSDVMNINLDDILPTPPKPTSFPAPFLNQAFFEAVKKLGIDQSTDGDERLYRCHGQDAEEILNIRHGKFNRIPDLILWPTCHDDVVKIVQLASDNDVCLIPFGGGTNVSGAVSCPQNESRCIVVVDTSQMNEMLWLNSKGLVACFQSGIAGQDLERILNKRGFTMGHEPDSIEFSTLGGWVATRASGMKKNVYGNIEDLVIRIKMVTPKGVLERHISAPRVSCGPDFNQLILGSEGTLGIITEVTFKLRPLPTVKKYGSLIFHDFETGIECLTEIAKRRCQPASIRLVDNEQFVLSQALKLQMSILSSCVDKFKRFMLTAVKGYDLTKLAVATLLFEGDKEDVQRQEKLVYEIAKKYSALNAGQSNGEKGYVLTYVIAYMRDFGMNFGMMSESFETSCLWNKCATLSSSTKATVRDECKKHKIEHFFISNRVTQTYDAGACIYFYFGFKLDTNILPDPIKVFYEIMAAAREAILAAGGTISHHHGVGKLRSRWYKKSVSQLGVNLYKAAKLELDPKNIFGLGNFLEPDDQIEFEKLNAKL